MTTIPGASQFLNAATLANTRGIAAAQPSLIGEAAGALDILDIARSSFSDNGVGLSSRARALNRQFLDQSSSGFNQIFSLNGVEFGTNETLQQAILALRASIPESRIAPGLRGETVDEQA